MHNKNPYIWGGLCLLVTGAILLIPAYFVLNLTWLVALSVCLLILAFIMLALGNTVPRLSPEVCQLLLETGIDNIATIVEELGIKTKAIYLPSSLTNDTKPRALIPLHSGPGKPNILKALPQRLITRYGTAPDDIGLLLSTVGSNAIELVETMPGPTPGELEMSLTNLFRGKLGVADSASVICQNSHIEVTIQNPRIENRATWSHHCLGCPLASIVASFAAEAWNKPVAITQEEFGKKQYSMIIEVLD
ncbi:MAG: hypothetical protein PHR43_01035 [Dehalococcoidales bacterium]|nr:hypothetical protein [Dehalococcoidales bacterium]